MTKKTTKKKSGKGKTKLPPKEESQFQLIEEFLTEWWQIRFNTITNVMEGRRINVFDDKGNELDMPFDAINENNIYRFLQHCNKKFSRGNLAALLGSDYVQRYNPIVDYFKGLPKWDKKDHIGQLCGFIRVKGEDKNQERFNTHFQKHLLRSIACALQDDYFNKHIFNLIGGQQKGKSTFIRWLCPPELKEKYYTENFSPDKKDKDNMIALSSNLFINMDELATLAKFEVKTLKTVLSTNRVNVRIPYDKATTNAPRRATFWGSTNEMDFLTDETGSVRWICFDIERIEFAYQENVDRTQLWAQLYHLYQTGAKFNITAEEIVENETVNAKHHVATMEEEMIQKYFSPAEKETKDAVFMTATDIVFHFVNLQGNAANRINPVGIGKALRFLDFPRTEEWVREKGMPSKGYFIVCSCKNCTDQRGLHNLYTEKLETSPA